MTQAGRRAEKVNISGRVQGVSYRAWARARARKLGVTGWVRNERNGTVTALVVGDAEAVAAMLEEFWKGPPAARVSSVETEPADSDSSPLTFEIVD